MAYRFRRSESAAAGARRIALEEVDKAIDRLDSPVDAEAVHAVRKGCKRLRGLLRLVRSGLGDNIYRAENAAFRELARRLSALRDADAVQEALGRLAARDPDALDFAAVGRALRGAGTPPPVGTVAHDALAGFREARLRVADWRIQGGDFDDVIGPGLARVYRRGCGAFRDARDNPSVAALHEWRKRVKDHWYQVRLLQSLWPKPLGARSNELKGLSEQLGEDHDLAMLSEMLPSAAAALGAAGHARLRGLVDDRRAALQASAFCLGARIHAERPKALRRRFYGYWAAWRLDG